MFTNYAVIKSTNPAHNLVFGCGFLTLYNCGFLNNVQLFGTKGHLPYSVSLLRSVNPGVLIDAKNNDETTSVNSSIPNPAERFINNVLYLSQILIDLKGVEPGKLPFSENQCVERRFNFSQIYVCLV